ncbi:MAG: hypothetical protein U1F26_18270 [Lysobacterales bacterium]
MTTTQIRCARILAALTLTVSWLLCLPAWGASTAAPTTLSIQPLSAADIR